MAVENMDIEPFIAERSHRFEPFLLAWPAAAHPDLHTVEPALSFGLAEPGDDATERLLHVGEVGVGAAYDDVPDPRQRAYLLSQDIHSPFTRVAGVSL